MHTCSHMNLYYAPLFTYEYIYIYTSMQECSIFVLMICVLAHASERAHTQARISMHVIYKHMHVYTTHTKTLHLNKYFLLPIYLYIHTHAYTHARVHTHAHTHIYAHLHIYIHTHMHIQIHMHIHCYACLSKKYLLSLMILCLHMLIN